MRRLCRAGLVLLLLVPSLATASARTGAPPTLESAITGMSTTWQQEADGAHRYPLLQTYLGQLTVNASSPTVFPADTWAPTWMSRLNDLSSDAAPDATTAFELRGHATPVALALLGDAGVDFSVASVAPYATDLRFGQGTLRDSYFYGGVARGAKAFDGNSGTEMVVNTGGSFTYPTRPSIGPGGVLSWEHVPALLRAPASAFNPAKGTFDDVEMVAALDTPILQVKGGDLTSYTQAAPVSAVLPSEVLPQGALAVYPTGLPGVAMTVTTVIPGAAQKDFHEVRWDVTAKPDTGTFWPETQTVGGARQWGWRPLFLNYGSVRSEGTAALTELDLPLPAGFSMVSVAADGSVKRIGPSRVPGTVHVANLGGHQRVAFTPVGTQGQQGGVTSTAGPARPISTPEVRGLVPAGDVSGALVDRAGIPTLEGLTVGGIRYGDIATPTIRVDGLTMPLGWDALVAPPQISYRGFGNSHGGFYGAGFVAQFLVETHGVMAEIEIIVDDTSLWNQASLRLLDVHPTDGAQRTVEIDWYSRPPAGTFSAEGATIPVEAVIHQECGCDVRATDAETGGELAYMRVTPSFVNQTDEDGLYGLWTLIADHGAWTTDPVAEVDGEALSGSIAVYMRIHVEGPLPSDTTPRGWVAIGTAEPLV